MRKTIIAPSFSLLSFSLLSLVLLVGINSVGCKSMPKSPWSKTAATDDASTATLARSAPAKPSDLAKQAELAATQVAGGEAVPFVPGVNIATPTTVAATPASPSAYPSTSSPSFIPTGAPSVAASTPVGSAVLGTVKLPYDPNAVPPATPSAEEAAIAAAAAAAKNRYANVSIPPGSIPQLSNSNTISAVPETSKEASRYGGYLASAQTPQTPSTSTPAAATMEMPTQVAAAAESLSTGAAGMPSSQYAQTVAATSASLPSAAPSYAPPTVTPTTAFPAAVASAAPYRPGGTSSYPSTANPSSGIQVATRPNSPIGADVQVPNLGAPPIGEPTPYPVTPQTPRYR